MEEERLWEVRMVEGVVGERNESFRD